MAKNLKLLCYLLVLYVWWLMLLAGNLVIVAFTRPIQHSRWLHFSYGQRYFYSSDFHCVRHRMTLGFMCFIISFNIQTTKTCVSNAFDNDELLWFPLHCLYILNIQIRKWSAMNDIKMHAKKNLSHMCKPQAHTRNIFALVAFYPSSSCRRRRRRHRCEVFLSSFTTLNQLNDPIFFVASIASFHIVCAFMTYSYKYFHQSIYDCNVRSSRHHQTLPTPWIYLLFIVGTNVRTQLYGEFRFCWRIYSFIRLLVLVLSFAFQTLICQVIASVPLQRLCFMSPHLSSLGGIATEKWYNTNHLMPRYL